MSVTLSNIVRHWVLGIKVTLGALDFRLEKRETLFFLVLGGLESGIKRPNTSGTSSVVRELVLCTQSWEDSAEYYPIGNAETEPMIFEHSPI